MTTVSIRKEDIGPGCTYEPEWLLIDADGLTLGRMASQIATLLRGKHKPIFTPHVDTGDFVLVINAAKIKITGAKVKDKYYYHHTGFPGGLKAVQTEKLLDEKPEELVRLAVKRMMPRNALNRHILQKLKIFPGAEHNHQAQQPRAYKLPY